MSLMQHYDKVITRMHADICRLIEEKAEIEACVEDLIAIRDQARAVHATGAACYNDTRTSVDRKKLSDLGLMVKESYKTIPSEFNGSDTGPDEIEYTRADLADTLAEAAEEVIKSATGAYNEKRTNVSKDKFKKLKDALAAYRGE